MSVRVRVSVIRNYIVELGSVLTNLNDGKLNNCISVVNLEHELIRKERDRLFSSLFQCIIIIIVLCCDVIVDRIVTQYTHTINKYILDTRIY